MLRAPGTSTPDAGPKRPARGGGSDAASRTARAPSESRADMPRYMSACSVRLYVVPRNSVAQRLVPYCTQREVARKAARGDAEHLLELTCQVTLVAKPARRRYMRGRHTASEQALSLG